MDRLIDELAVSIFGAYDIAPSIEITSSPYYRGAVTILVRAFPSPPHSFGLALGRFLRKLHDDDAYGYAVASMAEVYPRRWAITLLPKVQAAVAAPLKKLPKQGGFTYQELARLPTIVERYLRQPVLDFEVEQNDDGTSVLVATTASGVHRLQVADDLTVIT